MPSGVAPLKSQPDPAVEEADAHLAADRRNARVGGLFAGEEVLDLSGAPDRVGFAAPALHLRELRRHRVVLDEPLRVGAAAGLQPQRIGGQREVRLHVVVGALGAMGDDDRKALAERHQHGQQRLVEGADLVRLDQRGVDQAAVRGVLDGGVVGGDQVVADDQEPVALLVVEAPPTLVVVLGEPVFDREERDLELPDGAVVEREHAVPVEHGVALVAPEEVQADAVRDPELLAIGDLELGHRGVEGDGHVVAGPVAALLDGLLHHHPQADLGKRVVARVDVGREPSLQADPHHAAALRVLDDLLEPGLERDGHLLGVEVVPGAEDQEHRLLHADVGLGVLLLRVAPAHAAVPELPGGADGAQLEVQDFLHPPIDQPLLGRGSPGEPALGGDGERAGRMARLALALPELAVLARVRDQEVEARHDPDAEQQASGVDGRHRRRDQAESEQGDRGGQRDAGDVAAGARARGRHRQVVRRVGIVVEALALDPARAAPGRQHEHLREVAPAPGSRAGQRGRDLAGNRLVERVQARCREEVAQLVKGDGDVEGRVDEERGDERLGADEDELQHLAPGHRVAGQRQHRGDEGRVKGHQDVVREDPSLVKRGPPSRRQTPAPATPEGDQRGGVVADHSRFSRGAGIWAPDRNTRVDAPLE